MSLHGLVSAVKTPFCSHLMTIIAHDSSHCHGCNMQCICSDSRLQTCTVSWCHISPRLSLEFSWPIPERCSQRGWSWAETEQREKSSSFMVSEHTVGSGDYGHDGQRFLVFSLKVPSSIQLFAHQLLRPKATWNTADRTLRTLPIPEWQNHFHRFN